MNFTELEETIKSRLSQSEHSLQNWVSDRISKQASVEGEEMGKAPTHDDIAEYAYCIYQARVASGESDVSTDEDMLIDWFASEKFLTDRWKHGQRF